MPSLASTGLATLIDTFQIDYLLNGRFTAGAPKGRYLAEIIRATDGAHVWVRYFGPADADSVVAATIAGALIAHLRGTP